MKLFKIQDTKTGLYSLGGCQPLFNKKGKTWNSLQAVSSHLAMWNSRQIPETWEIIEFEVIETPVNKINAKQYKQR